MRALFHYFRGVLAISFALLHFSLLKWNALNPKPLCMGLWHSGDRLGWDDNDRGTGGQRELAVEGVRKGTETPV